MSRHAPVSDSLADFGWQLWLTETIQSGGCGVSPAAAGEVPPGDTHALSRPRYRDCALLWLQARGCWWDSRRHGAHQAGVCPGEGLQWKPIPCRLLWLISRPRTGAEGATSTSASCPTPTACGRGPGFGQQTEAEPGQLLSTDAL